jgi:cell division septation protein DedD
MSAATTVSQAMPPIATSNFDPAEVDSATRFNWCLAQQTTCPQMCYGTSSENFCEPTELTYSCSCPNGTTPDSTAFINTLPYFICQTTYTQCISDNPNDASAQTSCQGNLALCGTRNATAEAIFHEQNPDTLDSDTSSSSSSEETSSTSTPAAPTSSRTSISSQTTSQAPSSSPTSAPSTDSTTSDSSSSSLSPGAIAGIAIGAAVIIIIISLLFWWRRRRSSKATRPSVPELPPDESQRREMMTHANRHEMAENRYRAELGVGTEKAYGNVHPIELEGRAVR